MSSPRWRVTFEVDLGDNIPKKEDLKPHDHPLRSWASQTIFDLVLNHALLEAMEKKMEAMVSSDAEAIKKARIAAFDRQIEVCKQAKSSMKVELIEETDLQPIECCCEGCCELFVVKAPAWTNDAFENETEPDRRQMGAVFCPHCPTIRSLYDVACGDATDSANLSEGVWYGPATRPAQPSVS